MVTAFPKYESYKDSGVEWLGEIPEHWDLQRNKFIFTERKDTVGKKSRDFTLLSLTLRGVIARDMENPQGKFPAEFNTYKIVDPCNLIFCHFDIEETPRTVGYASQKGMITGAYTVIKCKENINSRYLYYYYLSLDFDKQLQPLYSGLRKVIKSDVFLGIKSPVPPIEEQNRIVDFLDRITSDIDKAIAKKQRLIELLNEQKAILINRAVTKGLNPNVPMRDSGIDAIGEIPKHWELKCLKHILKAIIDTEHKTAPSFEDGKFLIVRTSNVRDGKLRLEDALYTDMKHFLKWTRRAVPESGDVLFTREAPAGEACILPPDTKALIGQRMVLMKVNENILDAKFAIFSIYGGAAKQYITNLSVGSTVAHLNMSDIKNIPVLMPNLKEQSEISEYLEKSTTEFEVAIAMENQGISCLNELKSTLIANAVTGKIKV